MTRKLAINCNYMLLLLPQGARGTSAEAPQIGRSSPGDARPRCNASAPMAVPASQNRPSGALTSTTALRSVPLIQRQPLAQPRFRSATIDRLSQPKHGHGLHPQAQPPKGCKDRRAASQARSPPTRPKPPTHCSSCGQSPRLKPPPHAAIGSSAFQQQQSGWPAMPC